MDWLARTVEKLHSTGPLLWANLIIAVLVLGVLGGASAIARTAKAPESAAAPDFLDLTIAFAVAALAVVGMAVIRPSPSPLELKFHTLWLALTPFAVFLFLIIGVLGG